MDPPYPLPTRRDARQCYVHEMDESAHVDLAALLGSIAGRAMVSGYRCDLYDALYRDWRRVDFPSRTERGTASVESVWLSPGFGK